MKNRIKLITTTFWMTLIALWSWVTSPKRVGSPGKDRPLQNRDVMFEARDVDASIIGWVGLSVFLSAFVIYGVVKLSFVYFSHAEFRGIQPVTMVKGKAKPSTLPLLQVKPEEELEQLQRSDQLILNSYGWVDRNKGIVRIPISEAMKQVLKKGLPAAEKESASAPKGNNTVK